MKENAEEAEMSSASPQLWCRYNTSKRKEDRKQKWAEQTPDQDANLAKIRSTLCAFPKQILSIKGVSRWAGIARP